MQWLRGSAVLVGVSALAWACVFQVPFEDTAQDTAEPPDCSAYSYQGTVYDCTALDRCDTSQEAIPSRLACCDCDPEWCNPPPASCMDDTADDTAQ
jgi:hypothetical protein